MGAREIWIIFVLVFWGAVAIWSSLYDEKLDKHLEGMTQNELIAEMRKKGMLK